jgi:hypothetical protein
MEGRREMTPTFSKPLVIARLNVGDTIRLLDRTTVKIITLTDDYRRTKISTNKTATVRDVATGQEREVTLYGNQRYARMIEEDLPMSDVIVTSESTETKSFEQQLHDALAQAEAKHKAEVEQTQQAQEQEQTAHIARVKPFVDWLGLPGELTFGVEVPIVTYQGINFGIRSSFDNIKNRVYIKLTLIKPAPEVVKVDGFEWDWQSCWHEINHGWQAADQDTRATLLAEIAEYIPRIHAAYDRNMEKFEAWKTRVGANTPVKTNHTILFWHDGSGKDDELLCRKIDEGYRIVSMSAYGDEDHSAAFILMSKHPMPIVRRRVETISDFELPA